MTLITIANRILWLFLGWTLCCGCVSWHEGKDWTPFACVTGIVVVAIRQLREGEKTK